MPQTPTKGRCSSKGKLTYARAPPLSLSGGLWFISRSVFTDSLTGLQWRSLVPQEKVCFSSTLVLQAGLVTCMHFKARGTSW